MFGGRTKLSHSWQELQDFVHKHSQATGALQLTLFVGIAVPHAQKGSSRANDGQTDKFVCVDITKEKNMRKEKTL